MIKALALFSAGLDSLLAAKIILDQGVQVEAVHFLNAFLSGYIENPIPEQSLTKQKSIAGQLGIKLHIIDIAQVHLEMVKSPLFGYGKNLNPCIDCRILMLKQAKAYMQRHGFSFLISGEVLGQRPMSQRKDTLSLVERRAQVQGLLLRPLSAKLLAPTIPEEKGWVTREKLFAFSGRSRQAQLALVGELGMKEYLTPAGGCLLTQAEFARKFQDLVNRGNCGLEDVLLLKVGRHFSC
ncbi:MAG: hypothetical protein JW714_05520, partial [Candidatus Omnitrophica bacterium]|nr:hypothetical protein [Candidatus Omnitrophota bacterium]